MYASINANNVPTGYFLDQKHADGVGIPPGERLIEITDEQWHDCLDNQGARRWDEASSTFIAYTPPPRPLTDEQATAKSSIDQAAGRARLRFVSGGALIDQEYQRAEKVARDYIAAGYPAVVPLALQAEVDRTGATAQQAADNIIATANALNDALDQIRAARLAGKSAIDACVAVNPDVPTQAELDTLTAAEAAAIATLDAITPSVTGS